MSGVTVKVDLGAKSYDIAIGAGILPGAAARLSSVLPSKKICVVTDAVVAKHYLVPFMKSLEAAGFAAASRP